MHWLNIAIQGCHNSQVLQGAFCHRRIGNLIGGGVGLAVFVHRFLHLPVAAFACIQPGVPRHTFLA